MNIRFYYVILLFKFMIKNINFYVNVYLYLMLLIIFEYVCLNLYMNKKNLINIVNFILSF